ncbi:MAG: hypothetical protein INR73_24025 [Williamsia sp.]|nr:hypothetical protein [Williamsia sp.]
MKKLSILFFLGCAFFWQCSKDAGSALVGTPSGTGGSLARFTLLGTYLYTVDDRQLKVFDVTNAGDPVLKNTIDVGISIETIFPFKDKLFIGSSSVVYVYSVADPAKPQKLSEAVSPLIRWRCDPVVAKDTVAFATLRTNGPCGGTQSILACYDIKDVYNPVQKGSYFVSEPYGLGYAGDVLYVCDKSGLLVFDISKAYQPKLLKSLSGASYVDVIPFGDVLICWVTDGMIVYDITDNQNPVLLSKII